MSRARIQFINVKESETIQVPTINGETYFDTSIRNEVDSKRVKVDLAVEHEINIVQRGMGIEQHNEQRAGVKKWNNSVEPESTLEGNFEPNCETSLQDKIHILCKLSFLFQEEKDAAYAGIRKRKFGNSAS